jgi:hypothetical protein
MADKLIDRIEKEAISAGLSPEEAKKTAAKAMKSVKAAARTLDTSNPDLPESQWPSGFMDSQLKRVIETDIAPAVAQAQTRVASGDTNSPSVLNDAAKGAALTNVPDSQLNSDQLSLKRTAQAAKGLIEPAVLSYFNRQGVVAPTKEMQTKLQKSLEMHGMWPGSFDQVSDDQMKLADNLANTTTTSQITVDLGKDFGKVTFDADEFADVQTGPMSSSPLFDDLNLQRRAVMALSVGRPALPSEVLSDKGWRTALGVLRQGRTDLYGGVKGPDIASTTISQHDANVLKVDTSGMSNARPPGSQPEVNRRNAVPTNNLGDMYRDRDSIMHNVLDAQRLKEGMELYQDPLIGFIYVSDPGLAKRVQQSMKGGHIDPHVLTTEDRTNLMGQMSKYGFNDSGKIKEYFQRGLQFDGNGLDFLNTAAGTSFWQGVSQFNKMGGGGSGRVYQQYDPNQLKDQMRQLYQSWFQTDPTETELESFANSVYKTYLANQQANKGSVVTDVNPAAAAAATLRANPQYNQLFGKKEAGVSEEEYVGQFRQGVADLAGANVPVPSAVRAGMETGQVSTTLGQLFGRLAGKDNATFNERMARAAQTIASMT